MIVYLVIVLLSIVQSVFGVGLLVFGTPILLIMGFSFETVLSYLLPCSIAVSFLQTFQGWEKIGIFRKEVPLYILPFVVLGLVIIFSIGNKIDTKFFIGLILLLLGLIRLSKPLQEKLGIFFTKYLRLSFALTGTIHGLTNLGGGPLTILSNAVFKKKELIRTNIAYGYLLMALSQITVLLIMDRLIVGYETAFFPAIAILSYFIIGNRTFKAASDAIYYYLMTIFILLFGFILVLTSL